MNKITDKTRVLVTRLGDYWITQDQAKTIMQRKAMDPSGSVELENNIISHSVIDGILTPEKYQEHNLKKRGGWQCKYKHWHERYEKCAHGMAPVYF